VVVVVVGCCCCCGGGCCVTWPSHILLHCAMVSLQGINGGPVPGQFYLNGKALLLGGIPPPKNMSSSVGMMIFPIH
jgi:hypothetical protein